MHGLLQEDDEDMARAVEYLTRAAEEADAAKGAGKDAGTDGGEPPWRRDGGPALPGPPRGSAGGGAGGWATRRPGGGVPAAFALKTTAGGTVRAARAAGSTGAGSSAGGSRADGGGAGASSADAGGAGGAGLTTWTDAAGKEHTWRVPEKSKTGAWNKLATLVGLHLAGEQEALKSELDRLASFVPIQPQLAEIQRVWCQEGLEAFYRLGYLAKPKQ
ncbi:unnamed protein product [Symbiodinium natans]|uniref:Uncharacterized protein n=1 Tax=Symbiodinium natans TaxID=878477 RepID=A0A812NU46_9DINO|nr:unnamed protein product [Symbiodinium natans]